MCTDISLPISDNLPSIFYEQMLLCILFLRSSATVKFSSKFAAGNRVQRYAGFGCCSSIHWLWYRIGDSYALEAWMHD